MTRDVRALGLGALIVAFAWVTLRGLPRATATLRGTEEAVHQRTELLARSRSKVNDLSALDDSLRAYTEIASSLARLFLVGEDAGTASADLMRRVRERFRAFEHLTILGFQQGAEGGRSSGPLMLAAVVVTVEADFPALVPAIRSLERDSAMAVESFDVRAADPHAEGAERLTADIRVSGWFRPREERSSVPEEVFAR